MMNKKFNSPLFALLMMVIASFVLIASSFAWIARRFSPSITGSNLQIQSTGALRITYTDRASASSTASINDLITIDDFVFKQMSSADGTSFKYIDFNDASSANPLIKEITNIGNADSATMALGLIAFRFAVTIDQSTTGSRKVFLYAADGLTGSSNFTALSTIPVNTSDGTTTYDYQNAFRVSLTYTTGGTTYTKIFGNETANYDALNATSIGKEVTIDDDPASATYGDLVMVTSGVTLADIHSNQTVHSFTDYNGGRSSTDTDDWVLSENNPTIDDNKVLFTLNSTTNIIWIDCRIWLEGDDPRTVLEVNALLLNFLLKFDSIKVA